MGGYLPYNLVLLLLLVKLQTASAARAAAIAHRNHFFRLYQVNKSFEPK